LDCRLGVDGEAVGHHQDGVAIGRSFGHGAGADDRAAARPVLHHDGLAGNGLHALRQSARYKIYALPAGGKGNDDFDRMRRVFIGRAHAQGRGQCQCRGAKPQ